MLSDLNASRSGQQQLIESCRSLSTLDFPALTPKSCCSDTGKRKGFPRPEQTLWQQHLEPQSQWADVPSLPALLLPSQHRASGLSSGRSLPGCRSATTVLQSFRPAKSNQLSIPAYQCLKSCVCIDIRRCKNEEMDSSRSDEEMIDLSRLLAAALAEDLQHDTEQG